MEKFKVTVQHFSCKVRIQDGMPESGILIINNDNDILNLHKKEFKERLLPLGLKTRAISERKTCKNIRMDFHLR
ncbi:hypothetical protein [Caldicellulosiruptor bescii]|uniref:hypothetical protein n=1 Tax=Caldicellulosiruptor bescii TaxID=31899 RepID=UPI0021173893|nr:hypothetical protein [Caldicellulosiruptor bescii]